MKHTPVVRPSPHALAACLRRMLNNSHGVWQLARHDPAALDQFSRLLLEDVEFRTFEVWRWMGTPEGQVVLNEAAILIAPYEPQVGFVLDAAKMAAAWQREDQRGRVLLPYAAVAATLFVVAMYTWGNAA